MSQKGTNVCFYNGIDFDLLMKHSKDGSDGFIFCFIESWVKEIQRYNRNNKLKSVIEGVDYTDFEWDNINNDFIAIYQTDGIGIDLLYQAIRGKVINNHIPTSPYLSVTESDRSGIITGGGAWKIEVGKNDT